MDPRDLQGELADLLRQQSIETECGALIERERRAFVESRFLKQRSAALLHRHLDPAGSGLLRGLRHRDLLRVQGAVGLCDFSPAL